MRYNAVCKGVLCLKPGTVGYFALILLIFKQFWADFEPIFNIFVILSYFPESFFTFFSPLEPFENHFLTFLTF